MLRTEMLFREKCKIRTERADGEPESMADLVVPYLKYKGLEELEKERKTIRDFDLKWAREEVKFAADNDPEGMESDRAVKAFAKIDRANKALKMIDDHERAIRERIAASPTFAPGTRVRVKEDIWEMIGNPCATCPEIGIIGTVVEMDSFDLDCQKIPGRIKVQFANDLVGYDIDEHEDEYENTVRYFLWPYYLEEVGPEVESARPYDKEEVEPGDKRWTVIDLATGKEIVGHGCDTTSFEEVQRYVENTGLGYAAAFEGDDPEPTFVLPREGMKWSIIMTDGTEVGGHGCGTRKALLDYLDMIPIGTIEERPITDLDRQINLYVRC